MGPQIITLIAIILCQHVYLLLIKKFVVNIFCIAQKTVPTVDVFS